LSDYKLNPAKQQLLEGTPIKSVALEMGYSSVQHFSNAFKKKFGRYPATFRSVEEKEMPMAIFLRLSLW